VADFRVAHLASRKPNGFTSWLERGVGALSAERVVDGSARHQRGIRFLFDPGLTSGIDAPTVPNDQDYRPVRQFHHELLKTNPSEKDRRDGSAIQYKTDTSRAPLGL
jgi:hypothetical protein